MAKSYTPEQYERHKIRCANNVTKRKNADPQEFANKRKIWNKNTYIKRQQNLKMCLFLKVFSDN